MSYEYNPNKTYNPADLTPMNHHVMLINLKDTTVTKSGIVLAQLEGKYKKQRPSKEGIVYRLGRKQTPEYSELRQGDRVWMMGHVEAVSFTWKDEEYQIVPTEFLIAFEHAPGGNNGRKAKVTANT